MDQQGFARLQPCPVEHVAPDGEKGLRQGSGLLQGQSGRDRQALGRGRGAIFGVATAGQQGANWIADPPAIDAFAQCGNSAGYFQAGNVGGARRGRITALTLQAVGAVDASGSDLDQDFAGRGLGHGAAVGNQLFGAAGFGDFDDGHHFGQIQGHGVVSKSM